MPTRSFLPHWLLWCLPAVLSAQIVMMLLSSEPDSAWRDGEFTLLMAGGAGAATCACLWALWQLREWPIALRGFIALLSVPLLAGALLMAGA